VGKLCTNILRINFYFCSQQAHTLEGGNRWIGNVLLDDEENSWLLPKKDATKQNSHIPIIP